MQTERLWKVVADDPRLFKEHTEVSLIVKFEQDLTKEQREAFRQVVDCWSLLGQFAPMPLYRVFDIPAFRKLTDREKRLEVFRGSYMKYCSNVQYVEHAEARVDFDLWTLDRAWLDVLLNCLEAYHVQVARIRQVELKAEW